jgi:integrase/recombinase XerC
MSLPAIRPRPKLPRVGPRGLYQALLADSRCENTLNARVHDVRVFGKFLGQDDPVAACALLIAGGRGNANAIALAFRQGEVDRGSAAASVNRRLATLRRLALIGRRLDLIDWALDVDELPIAKSKDMSGPGSEGWRKLWAAAVDAGDAPLARRNRALLRLMHDNAFRKSEATGLDVEDVDLDCRRLAVRGKGRSGKTWVTINERCVDLLRAWLDARGGPPRGPLFTSYPKADSAGGELGRRVVELRAGGMTLREVAALFNAEGMTTPLGRPWSVKTIYKHFGMTDPRGVRMSRLPDRQVNRIVHELAESAGLARALRPHGIRHQSITQALDATNGDVRRVQKFARHLSTATTIRYDDARRDLAGEVARLLGEDD